MTLKVKNKGMRFLNAGFYFQLQDQHVCQYVARNPTDIGNLLKSSMKDFQQVLKSAVAIKNESIHTCAPSFYMPTFCVHV